MKDAFDDLQMAIRLSLKQLTRQRLWSSFFVLNLSLSLAAILLVLGFRDSIRDQLQQNSKNVLGADLAVSARRKILENEVKILNQNVPADAASSEVFDFFAMMKFKDNSRLVLVRAIDANYPLYGRLLNPEQQDLKEKFSELAAGSAFIYPELQQQLDLNLNEEIQIGNLKLKVSQIIEKDETQTFRGASIAPRVFIDKARLEGSGLIQFGSTFTQSFLYKLSKPEQGDLIKEQIYKSITDPGFQVETSESAGADSGRQFAYLSDYLGLIAMVSFLISLLGSFYLLRANLNQSIKSFAILRSVGMTPAKVESIELLRVFFLGLTASGLAIPLSQFLGPALIQVLRSLMTVDLSIHLNLQNIFFALLLSPGLLLLFLLPQIRQLRKVRPNQLFSEANVESVKSGVQALWVLVILALVYLICVWLTKSYFTSLAFVGGIFVSGVLLGLVGWISQKVLADRSWKTWQVRFGLLSLSRNPRSLLILVCTIGLGSLMATLPSQLKNSLLNEFSVDRTSEVPNLFMFDIQDEQIEKITAVVKEEQAQSLITSPLIRARIKTVNQQPYERKIEDNSFQTREQERDARFRNRGVNLSYRDKLSASERIVEGRDFSGRYQEGSETIEVSVEQKYAERVGLKIGDKMVFDIQGVEMEAVVINLRHVKWTSFTPNFFILVQPGSLDLAPKTWITGVGGLRASEVERLKKLQARIVQVAPNVSIVNLGKTIAEVLQLSEKMVGALQLMAGLCLLTGFMILYSLIQIQIQVRGKEFNMLRVLGATRDKLFVYISAPFVLIVGVAVLVGVGLSVVTSNLLLRFVFELKGAYDFISPLWMIAAISLLSLIVILGSVQRVFSKSPSEVFRE